MVKLDGDNGDDDEKKKKGIVAQAFNPSTQQAKHVDLCGLEANLIHIVILGHLELRSETCL